MAELDGRRIAAVFAADTAMNVAAGSVSHFDSHIHKFAYAGGVKTCERIGLENLVLVVRRQEFACVVAAETEGHLRKVVGTEAEEFGFFCDFVSGKCRARDFDHGTDFVFKVAACCFDESVGGFDDGLLAESKFLNFANQRNHDFGNDVPIGMTVLYRDCSLDDCFRLHFCDFGIRYRKTASAMSHHRVEFVQRIADNFDFFNGLALRFCKFFDVLFFGGNELVKRRIEETNGNGMSFKGFHKAFEVSLLHRFDLIKGFSAFFDGFGANHLTELVDTAGAEEHMFGTAKTDALCAEFGSAFCVGGGVCVGADVHCLIFVGKAHNSSEVTAVGICGDGLDCDVVNVTGASVKGEVVAFVEDFPAEFKEFVGFVHFDVAATGNTAGAHSAGDNRRVGGLTAANGKDTLRVFHTFDVFGRGFKTYEDDFLARLTESDGFFGGENDCACRCAGRRRDTFADDVVFVCRFKGCRVELRMQKHIESFCVDLEERFLFVDHTFVDKIASDTDSGGSGTLAVSGLKHEEFAAFDGEFHILHIAVVAFKSLADVKELFVNVGKDFRHLADGHRGTNACDDVFALSVHKELAHKTFFAGCGVTSERNAGAAIVAHVTESHHLYVDRSAPAVRNVVVHTIDVCTGVVPASENSLDCAEKLFFRVGGEIAADFCLVFRLELICKFFKVVCVEVDILLYALLRFHFVDEFFKVLFADFHNDVGVHLNETTIAVPCPTGVARFCGKDFNDFFVKTKVKNGVHHTGHRCASARTNGYEKGIFFIAEFFAGDVFEFFDVVHDFGLDIVIDSLAVFVVLRASFGRNGETLGNGKTDVGHFREVCALAAEKFTHVGVTFGEKINVLFHKIKTSKRF